jgi:hypothetical protein
MFKSMPPIKYMYKLTDPLVHPLLRKYTLTNDDIQIIIDKVFAQLSNDLTKESFLETLTGLCLQEVLVNKTKETRIKLFAPNVRRLLRFQIQTYIKHHYMDSCPAVLEITNT